MREKYEIFKREIVDDYWWNCPLGNAIVDYVVKNIKSKRLIIFSRDELKQSNMQKNILTINMFMIFLDIDKDNTTAMDNVSINSHRSLEASSCI